MSGSWQVVKGEGGRFAKSRYKYPFPVLGHPGSRINHLPGDVIAKFPSQHVPNDTECSAAIVAGEILVRSSFFLLAVSS